LKLLKLKLLALFEIADKSMKIPLSEIFCRVCPLFQ